MSIGIEIILKYCVDDDFRVLGVSKTFYGYNYRFWNELFNFASTISFNLRLGIHLKHQKFVSWFSKTWETDGRTDGSAGGRGGVRARADGGADWQGVSEAKVSNSFQKH